MCNSTDSASVIVQPGASAPVTAYMATVIKAGVLLAALLVVPFVVRSEFWLSFWLLVLMFATAGVQYNPVVKPATVPLQGGNFVSVTYPVLHSTIYGNHDIASVSGSVVTCQVL